MTPTSTRTPTPTPATASRSLRFFGNGTGDIDRVKIDISTPNNSVDVGGDLTIEFWMKANPGENTSGVCQSSTTSGANWIFGNTLIDRDIYYVSVADTNMLDLTTNMTLAAWVYPTSGNRWGTVVFKAQSGSLVYALYAGSGSPDRPRGYVYRNGEQEVAGSATLPLNSWSHIATTYDGSTLRFFVNGSIVGSSVVSGAIPVSTGILSIGGSQVYPNDDFAGRIDDVRIYNRALSATEIQTAAATSVGSMAGTTTSRVRTTAK